MHTEFLCSYINVVHHAVVFVGEWQWRGGTLSGPQTPELELYTCKHVGMRDMDDGLWVVRTFSVFVRVSLAWETCPAAVSLSVTASGVS